MIIYKPTNEEKEKLKTFKEKHIHKYDDYLQEEIENKLLLGFTNNNDIINQIYCYLGITPENIDPYKEFIKIIKKEFNYNKNILEVGAGALPVLSWYMENDEYKNISLIDPGIIFENILKSTCIKEEFNELYNINDYNLIIGFNPCKATESIIRNSIKNKKDFIILTCNCCFLPENYKERTPELWHKYLIELAHCLSDNKYDIKIKYLNKKYNIDTPIIIGKLKQKN